MKVTVNFGVVRVIVPCGSGDLVVRRLMELAITRYKKATGKDVDIIIHNLKVLSDGGILDPDDKLNDVVDDKEQIIAAFAEASLPPYPSHNAGDGTSASSVGTESPDFFQSQELLDLHLEKPLCNGSNIEHTNLSTGSLLLHVRRGSEPALNRLPQSADPSKRWSAAIMVDGDRLRTFSNDGDNSEQSENEFPPGEREDGSGEEKASPTQDKRQEPLGGPLTSPLLKNNINEHCEVVKLKNGDGPLGIHVVPAYDNYGKDVGLVIQGIEPGGRIDRDGRFSVGDTITEVNGLTLDKSFRSSQEIFKDALKAPEISLACTRSNTSVKLSSSTRSTPPPPPPIFPKPFLKADVDSSDGFTEDEKVPAGCNAKSKVLTPSKKLLAHSKNQSSAHSSLRKVGRRILVHLTKGNVGLGFSVSTKEVGSPLFIKSILPTGAAVEDGRLKVGDRILEVNRVDVTNKTQAEVVSLLRQTEFGDSVELVVSRPETDNSPSPHLPRQLPPEEASDELCIVPWRRREVFTLDIPLNDTGAAGLGVSVKGKTSNTNKGPVDMGIFVKCVIHGGAASKDGRLRMNDQLLNINGKSLLSMSNGQAMEALRRAIIQSEGPNALTLTVARRLSISLPDDTTDSSCHEKSDSMLSESGESFYVSNENLLLVKGATPDTSTSDHSGRTVIQAPNYEETISEEAGHSEEGHSILEQLTSFVWQGASSRSEVLSSYQHNLGKVQQELTLIDIDPDKHYTFTKQSSSVQRDDVFHKKSSSCSTEVMSPPGVPSQRRNKGHYRKNEDERFLRNGFGRQSMPEKELHQHADEDQWQNAQKSFQNAASHLRPLAKNSNNSSSEHIPREMAVDVQLPINGYTKVVPRKRKAPRTGSTNKEVANPTLRNSVDSVASLYSACGQGSCHSPGCPYHAVPTNGQDCPTKQGPACVGPTLGMCKSSSLESLQTMVHQMQKMDTRGCNESFRAAVDRSYEAPNAQAKDSVIENGSSRTGLLHRPSVALSHTRADTEDAQTTKKGSKTTKKKGLFKGLGSVFRFGKSNKKSDCESSSPKKSEKQRDLEKLEARKAAEEERERIEQHYLKLVQQQKMIDSCQTSNSRQVTNGHVHNTSNPTVAINLTCPNSDNRQTKMHQLRAEHQRRHQQRQGCYPREAQEEFFEQRIKKTVDKTEIWHRPLPPLPHQTANQGKKNGEVPYRSYEIYKEMSKPGSRRGFVDPDRKTHYMNFQEIQHQLQQFQDDPMTDAQAVPTKSSKSYRHTLSAARSRPLSNFLDYESVYTMYSKRNVAKSLPRQSFSYNKQRPPIPEYMYNQASNQYSVPNKYPANKRTEASSKV